MFMNFMKNETVRLTVILAAICLVVALVLSVFNEYTQPLIDANKEIKNNKALNSVLIEAETFEPFDISNFDTGDPAVSVTAAHIGLRDGSPVGFTVSVLCTEGYAGDIEIMTGFGWEDIEIKKIEYLSISETPGLGMNAKDESFTSKFKGKTGNLKIVKRKTSADNEISAVSGATITSNAVVKAVNTAYSAALHMMENYDGFTAESEENFDFYEQENLDENIAEESQEESITETDEGESYEEPQLENEGGEAE